MPSARCASLGIGDGDGVLPGGRLTFEANAVKITTVANRMRTARIAIRTSNFSIFLPTYSGVRPTIRPAMNTATTAYISIPYSPAPTPPKMVSSHIRLISGTAPPIGV